MSPPPTRHPLFWLAALLLALGGCSAQSSVPPHAAPAPPRPPADLATIKNEIQDAQAQLTVTQSALDALAKSRAGEAGKNFDAFNAQYFKLQSRANAVRSRAYDLKSAATAYYARWDDQVHADSAQQKADAHQVYSTITGEMESSRAAFTYYMANLDDIRRFLSANTTTAGVEAVADLLAKSNVQARDLQGHLNTLAAAIDQLNAGAGVTATAP